MNSNNIWSVELFRNKVLRLEHLNCDKYSAIKEAIMWMELYGSPLTDWIMTTNANGFVCRKGTLLIRLTAPESYKPDFPLITTKDIESKLLIYTTRINESIKHRTEIYPLHHYPLFERLKTEMEVQDEKSSLKHFTYPEKLNLLKEMEFFLLRHSLMLDMSSDTDLQI